MVGEDDEADISAVVVGDGARVLDTLRQVRADLLILDNMMPGLKGVDVFDQIRADGELKWLPVLFVTAALHSSERDFSRRGIMDVIAKPCDLNDLLGRARSTLVAARRDSR